MFWLTPITLRGTHVVLEPLSPDHSSDLQIAVADGRLHELWYTSVASPENMAADVQRRIDQGAAGLIMPFAAVDPETGKAVGMTSYLNLDAKNKRLEIGATWYRKSVQRSPLNTEAKLLLLTHAFEELNCIAVEFRTHFLNQQSRRAIERLGAKLDGVLRCHQVMANGTLRDTAAYSIIACEWPAIKAGLTHKLGRRSFEELT